MEQDTVSWWWAIATVGGPIILALALAYGVMKTKPWKSRMDRRRARKGEKTSRDGVPHAR
jgi:hypothetical protein